MRVRLFLVVIIISSLSLATVIKIAKGFHISRENIANNTLVAPLATGLGSLGPVFDQPVIRNDIIETNNSQPFPTNTWWSSVLTADFPETLFSLPLATKLSPDGIGMGAPLPVASSQTFSTPYTADMHVSFPNQTVSKVGVASWSSFAVKFSLLNAKGEPFATVDIIKGSPVLRVTSSIPMLIKGASAFPDGSTLGVPAITTINNRSYLLSTSTQLQATAEKNVMSTTAGRVTIGALPSKFTPDILKMFADEALLAAPTTQVTAASTDLTATTTLLWNGQKADEKHLTLLLPHQYNDSTRNIPVMASYSTLRGTARLLNVSQLAISYPINGELSPTVPPEDAFFQKATLESYLQSALATLPVVPSGSYYGGKAVYRMARLYETALIANSSTAVAFANKLETELTDWFTYTSGENGKYFRYEKTLGGIVAGNPEFGNELYNDHHFHYGYFIYAAAVVAEHNEKFRTAYAPMVSLLARDIAAPDGDSAFTATRTFDPYEGHSWAGGISRFADGNNQESSSEAINAWQAVMRWSKVDGNAQQRTTAAVLLAQEQITAQDYWFGIGPNATFPAGFTSPFVSLVWSGKADYATWFSAKDEAKLGIQLLPIGAQSIYLQSIKLPPIVNTFARHDTRAAWKDQIVMALALQDPKRAAVAFNPQDLMDESNSLPTYYLWIADRLHTP